VIKGELTNRNLKQLIIYINSTDLEKINHSNEQLSWTLNNRNVKLQSHVVLHSIMEQAEDLKVKQFRYRTRVAQRVPGR